MNCHNTYQDTPKHDWETGDVRGILEFVQPMDAFIAQTNEGLKGSFMLEVLLSMMGLWAFSLAVSELRQRAQEVKKRATGLEHEIVECEKAEAEREALKELIYTSRRVGMAEVATGVLHNVGNILNSVSVSAGLIGKLAQESSAEKLQRTAGMLSQHHQDIGEFLTQHPKGQLIPEYLTELGDHLVREQGTVVKEADELTMNIDHMSHVIQKQQSIAHSSGGHRGLVAAQDLMAQALLINMASLDRHGIEVVREYADVPQLLTDRHQALQILVNLVSNAKYAAMRHEGESGCLTLSIRGVEGQERHVQLQVQDNGIGVKLEHLTQIFSQGFTTKKEGHGFGLHMSALSAKNLGGTLTAHSDGEGQGATFTLELPVNDGMSLQTAE
jgi:signal transduction histidine kinase